MTWTRIASYIGAIALMCAVGGAFQPAWATLPTPNQSILVVQASTSADPYQNFVPELLLTEGLNGFQNAQLSELTAAFLANYDIVILPHLTLTSAQATLFQNYVNAGGTLVGFRPDLQLANTFGVASLGTTLAEGWLQIDTSTTYSSGLDSSVMKFHGTADLYALNGATPVASLYSNPNSPTTSPAATIYTFGLGKAILFSFDLTQSIVLMRQGNPAWAGYPNNHDGFNTLRPSQMFMDQGTGQYWNDLGDGTLNDVPQADIQLHLFSNMVTLANAATRPFPRLWYYPNRARSLLLMTGDHHNDPVANSISEINAVQAAGGKFSEFLWYPFSAINSTQVSTWVSAGHAMGVHFDGTGEVDASGVGGSAVTWNGMQTLISNGVSLFAATYPTAPPPTTTRNHLLIWLSRNASGNPDQTAQAKLFQSNGVELDVTYTAFPNRWGYMTGSGLPMKFLDTATGAVIPVYEQATQYEDDIQLGGTTYSLAWNLATARSHYQKSLSDSMSKYNTVLTMLFHPDHWSEYSGYAQTVLQYAQQNSIPMYSTADWLLFWKGRAATTFSKPAFVSNKLTFTATGSSSGLTLLLPDTLGNNKVLAAFEVDSVPQNFTPVTYQGVTYASVILAAGTHNIVVTYIPAGRILGQVSPSAVAGSTTIQVQGGSISQSYSVAANGTYAAGPLPAGTYTVTPTSLLSNFAPASQSVTLGTADVTGVNFTATQPTFGETLFTTQTPAVGNGSDGVNYEMGTAFTTTVAGQITGVRFWKAPGEVGAHTGNIWSSTGQLLASVTFANETASGWQQQALATPILIAGNTQYVVSVNTANTFYVATSSGLASQVANGHLRSVVGNNGLYGVTPGQFPTSSHLNANYFRDVFFVPNSVSLASVTLNPNIVDGGNASTGTVTLSNIAPAGGVVVSLQSNNVAATVPASVTVPEGATGATFTVGTTIVATNVSATITASANGTTGSATLTIKSPAVSALSVSPTQIAGGNSVVGTVTLTGPAPAGGAVVALSGGVPVVPGVEGVTSLDGLPQGGSIDWASVGPDYTSVNSGLSVPVNGLSGVNATLATANGRPMMILVNCSTGQNCGWWGNFASGSSMLWMSGSYDYSTGMWYWWTPNGPLTITFNSPQSGVGFQAMADERGLFTATLCAYNASNTLLGCVPFNGTASGTADNSAPFMGLYSDAQEITKVTIDAGGVIYPHDFAMGKMFVTGARRQLLPATVTVPAGATTATFPVSTSSVTATTPVDITATYLATQTATLSITPATLGAVAMTPSAVLGGTALVGTATLTGAAPAGGVVVSLSADNPVSVGVQSVNSDTNLPQDGHVLWTDIGPAYTSVPSGSALPVTGLPGTTVTVSTANGLSSLILTNCPAIADCGWGGNFAPAAPILWVAGNYDQVGNWISNGPLTLTFNTPQRGIGFNVMADEAGNFTGTACAYNTSNTLLGCVPFSGYGAPLAGGTIDLAAYVGIYDDTAEIAKVVIDGGGPTYPHDFAIGQLFVATSRRMVPPSVTVQAGSRQATFAVNTDRVNTVTNVAITGNYQGAHAGVLTVIPLPALASVTMSPASVGGGNSPTGTVTLNGPAPTGGALVTLSNSNTAAATVPASVTVAEGATSATFAVTTVAVTTSTSATVTATYNGSIQTAALSINPLAISTMVMNPATIPAGTTSTGTVTLNGPAPTGGAVVTLSDNSASSTTPASVTVAAGATSATFTVTTSLVATSTGVTITGNYNGSTLTASLTINPLAISTLVMNPASVIGGNSSTGTVTLNGPAPAGGAVVTLSDNSASSTTPASVTVVTGATSATFTVTTSLVATSTGVTITGNYNGSTLTASLTINPLAISTLVMNPASVIGGNSSTGTVTLNSPAPTGGSVVTLADNSASSTTPASVTVAAGATSATFTVTTSTVTTSTPVTITGTYNGSTQSTPLTVNPVALVSVTLNPFSLVAGASTTGTVTLNAPAAGTAAQRTVTLSDNNAASTTPASVQVAAGATTATFTITTTVVTAPTPVTVTATYNGSTQTADLIVNPVIATSVTMSPTSVLVTASSVGTVTLNAPALGTAAQRTVTLSDTSGSATTPASVQVAAGATTATFTVTTSVVSAVTPVTIIASYNGSTPTAVLTINPVVLASVTLNPTSIGGGGSSTGTVTLSVPAVGTAAQRTVTLSDNSAAATTPASVVVASGVTTATFTVTTVAVATPTPATITALYNESTQTAVLTVNPTALAALVMNPPTAAGGSSSVGTVTLNGPAPTGGAVVTLTDDSTFANTPASVTVAAGATSANFTVTTVAVTVTNPVTITATYGASTQTAGLTINPLAVATLTINPATVGSGSAPTGTVTLNGPAPTGGAVVTLSSSNTAAATVPVSVTVAAGATSANFAVTALAVSTSTPVTITGGYNGSTQIGVLTVNPLAVATVALNPTTVTGSSFSTGTVTLNGPAPAGGAVITLSNSNTAAATVPATVTVAAGATGVTFTVTTAAIAASTSATITATYNGSSQGATLTISLVAFVKSAGNSGQSVPYTVTISPVAGNFVAVFVWQIETATTPTIADNLGSTYTQDCNLTFDQGYGGLRRLTVYHLLGAPSGITSLTITPNKPSRAIVAEYAGMSSGAVLDVCGTVNNQVTSTTTWTSPATTTTGIDLIFGLADTGTVGNAGYAATGSWTGRVVQHDPIDGDDSYVEDQINVPPGTYTATGTTTVAARESSIVVAFKTGR